MYLTGLVTLLVMVTTSHGYMGGAPAGSCDGMTPSHDGNSGQTGASSYTITLSATTYNQGDTITVTLGGGTFKGFLCQARTDVSDYATVTGTLTDTDGSVTTTNNCGSNNALTHTENGDKTSFQFTWAPEQSSSGTVYILCTIVQSKPTFWVKQASSAITYTGAADALTGLSPLIMLLAAVLSHVISKDIL